MKRQPSYGFNKEKLIFLGTSALLALCVYYLLTSQPSELNPGTMVSSQSPPGPVDPDKPDTRVADVRYYLDDGAFVNFVTNAPVNRKRKNAFQPIDDFKMGLNNPAIAKNAPNNKNAPPAPPPVAPAPPPPPEAKKEEKEKEEKVFDPNDIIAKVDFSGVATMNGQTYGILKSKDGTNIQVKVGDYLEEFKYTVSKIDKQAIWVTDDENHLFVARDTTFSNNGGSGDEGGDKGEKEKPKKKEKPAAKEMAKETKPAAKPTQPHPPAGNNVAANNGNNANNNRPTGRRPGRNGENPFNANGNGNGGTGTGNVPPNVQNWLKNMGIQMGN